MKKFAVVTVLGLIATAASAQEVGRVVSAVPVVQQVAVPQQVCTQGQAAAQTSGAGGVMGALAGGGIGSTLGRGNGRVAATLLGVVGGAILGNQIEAGGNAQAQAPQCTTQTTYENRTVGYSVTYEYAGRQYTVQMPQDPGPTVRLQVTPVGASSPATLSAAPSGQGLVSAPPLADGAVVSQAQPAVQAPVVYAAPAVVQPQVIVQTAYPVSYYRPYYNPPVMVTVEPGYYRYRHWR